VSENRALRRIFGPKREEGTGGWRRLDNELRNLYNSRNVIRVTKSRRMRWAGHVARTGEMRNAEIFWSENLKVRDYLEYLGKDGRIILEWMLGT
jgi:hypothetical protein